MIDNDDVEIIEFLEKLAAFNTRKTDLCIHCGKQVIALEQIGRCTYARPCGCRLWQGKIPEAWRAKSK